MDNIDLLMKEYDAAVKAFLQAKDNKQKAVRVCLGIIGTVLALSIKGILPPEAYSLASLLTIIFFSYLTYISHVQSCASGAAQISEKKLSSLIESETSGAVVFDLSKRTQYLRDGNGGTDRFGRFTRSIMILSLVIATSIMTHVGLSSMELEQSHYIFGVALFYLCVIFIAALGYRQNQLRKNRFANIIENHFVVPNI